MVSHALTEEASRFCERENDYREYRLAHRVIQAVRGCQANNALMIRYVLLSSLKPGEVHFY